MEMGMVDWARVLPFALAGGALGALHFGGLWYTLRRLPRVRRPGLWMGGSFILRTVVVLAGFYAIVGAGLPAVVAAMSGFIAVRLIFGRRLRPRDRDRG